MNYKNNNIIFDLGGVILNLNIELTIKSFANLSGKDPHKIVHNYWKHEKFHQYEKGLIDDTSFRDFLREFLEVNVTDSRLDQAWNAMILDLPISRLNLLKELSHNRRIFLLSNTNNIHLKRFNHVYESVGNGSFNDYFEQAYYSHHVHMRKPDAEIFQYVIDQNKLDPNETLFLDDNMDNIEGANAVGLRTIHIQSPDQLNVIFDARKA